MSDDDDFMLEDEEEVRLKRLVIDAKLTFFYTVYILF